MGLRLIAERPPSQAVFAPASSPSPPRACSLSPRVSSRDSRCGKRSAVSSQFDRSAVAVAAAAASSDNAAVADNDNDVSTSTSTSTSTWRTCKHCKRRFDPNDNPPTACRRHPALFTGGEVSKAIGFCREGQGSEHWLDAVVGNSGLMRFYDCCGASDEGAPGCVVGPHEGF